MQIRVKLAILLLVTLAGNVATAQRPRTTDQIVPSGKGWGVLLPGPDNDSGAKKTAAQGANGMIYHGGAVMAGNVNVYFIWYGNWTNGAQPSDSQITVALLDELFAKTGGIGGSNYAMINTTYADSKKKMATGSFSLAHSTEDNYSSGKNLTDTTVKTVVTNAIKSGKLPKDTNGVYFVLASSDVDETSGLCKQYCGWHSHANILSSDIKFAFVGNTDRCPLSCEAQTNSPNGDSGADGMASVMVHETSETLTDPDMNGWYDAKGEEVGDKCAWMYGPVQGAMGYGAYNQTFGNRNWLIQLNWENTRGGGCAQTKGGEFYNY